MTVDTLIEDDRWAAIDLPADGRAAADATPELVAALASEVLLDDVGLTTPDMVSTAVVAPVDESSPWP